jgi:hypothetical protein
MNVMPDHRLRMVRPGILAMWCPGCMKAHQLDVHGINHDGKAIGWDGDHARPTIEPTLKFDGCELLLRAGTIYFLNNCRHSLAGQTVPLPHFPLP